MRSRSGLTLAVLAIAQFMVVLDVTIVNVALPDIRSGVGFSADGLQWVVSAYTLSFGGFLLLGGRAADLLGRRAVFLAGLAVFGIGSLGAGLATSPTAMVVARAIQGLGAAALSPAALALLMVTFAHGRERNMAMGVWAALAGLGGTLGTVLGGALVDGPGWEWVFFVNVPIAALLAPLVPMVVAESRAEVVSDRSFDVAGAVLGTGGLLGIIFGVIRAQPLGWGSAEVIACLAAGVALLVAFFRVEKRSPDPLVPLPLFRLRSLRMASASLAINGGAFLSMFFLTAIFLQQVRGESALGTGLQLLPMGLAAVVGAGFASNLVLRLGTRPIQTTGALLSTVGLWYLSTADAHSAYASGLLPGLLLLGAGITTIGVPGQIAAIAEVDAEQSGAASGLVTAGYQVGGALGIALITTLSTNAVAHALAGGSSPSDALVDGFQRGMLVAAAFSAFNILLSLASPKIAPDSEQMAAALAGA
ncbi:Multidrug resistance protein Stp [Baekduia alba]|uniref:MFS transporter n=1 Tax=Baekduia alba TaxID=2997333 RepID=UPI002341E939|nr:MFS transporter [Baekduia alba]WCB93470.1 Multidrug resistance protein Stp [Baekduia alba]